MRPATVHEFREHDVRRFNAQEQALWRGGQWYHEWHDGRYGWWWNVAGIWYFYEAAIYPYPLYVAETFYMPPAQPAPPPPVAAQPQQYWYYCDNPAGYYPYVPTCPTAWRPVSATPPGTTQ